MSDIGSEFLAEIARKVAASDAQADADLAAILAGRPYHRRVAKPKPEPGETPAPVRKPRARRIAKPKT